MKSDRPSSSEERTQLPSGVEKPTQPPAAGSVGESATLTQQPGERTPQGPAATSAALPEQLPAPFGRYQLLKLLGQGGMGAVYLARDEQLDRPVALKVPFFSAADGPHVLERFRREARAAATLRHANVCPVYDVGEINGVHYLTMAYIEGKSLAEVLRAAKKPLAARQAAALVRKLALALDEAHRQHVIHRDLKPANVMMAARGEPVIMDFGLARRGNTSDVHLTRQGTVMGTPSYMAPEQAKGDVAQMGPACDIYSLGVILYELLAGRVPFTGDMVAVLSQLLTDEPPPPSRHRPDLDPSLEAICLKAMAKQPAARYASMAEFAAALAGYLKKDDQTVMTEAAAPTPTPAPPPVPTAAAARPATMPAAPPRGRTGILLGLAALGVVLLLGASGAYLAFHHKADAPDRGEGSSAKTDDRSAKEPPAAEVKPDESVAYAWPAEARREGKVAAPDLGQVPPMFQDHFNDPSSGFPSGPGGAKGGAHGYRGGKYFIDVPGTGSFFWSVPLGRAQAAPLGAFACRLVGRAKGVRASWGLSVVEREADDEIHRLSISVVNNGQLHVAQFAGGPGNPLHEPVAHPAIKAGGNVPNTLLVILRGRQLEVYVNGVAVCDPLLLERAFSARGLALEGHGGTRNGGTAEFEALTVWPADSVPPLAARGAKPKP